MKRPVESQVESEEGIVFSEMVASAVHIVHESRCRIGDAARRAAGAIVGRLNIGDWLCGMRLNPDVAMKTPGQVCNGVGIELVRFVAVRQGIFRCQVEEIGVKKTE